MPAAGGSRRLAPLLTLLCLGGGCRDEAAPDAGVADAAAVVALPSVFEDPETKVRFTWPSSWLREASPSTGEPGSVSTLARLTRPRTTS